MDHDAATEHPTPDSSNVMAVGDADAYPDIDVFTASARNELHALAGQLKPVTATR